VKILSGAACIVVVLIGIGLFNVGKTVNHDQNTSDRVSSVWSQVQVGMSEDEVRSILGTPDDETHFTTSNFNGGTDKDDTWMYGTLSDTTYSVDFINGVVDSKSSM